MKYSKKTQWVYDGYVPPCFVVECEEVGGVEKPCGLPSVGVYISADDQLELRPFCMKHAKTMDGGDGPTFWLVPINEGRDVEEDYAEAYHRTGGEPDGDEVGFR